MRKDSVEEWKRAGEGAALAGSASMVRVLLDKKGGISRLLGAPRETTRFPDGLFNSPVA